jgi:hypothetical protein
MRETRLSGSEGGGASALPTPILRTGLADLPHPALQLVVSFQEDRHATAWACFRENKPTVVK